MRRTILAALLTLMSVVSAHAQTGPPTKAQVEAINRQFKDRNITARMDLPIVHSVYVTPDGQYDEARYRDRLAAQPPSIPRDETAKLTKIEVDGDKINININGGGMAKPRGANTFVIGGRKRRGSRIEIEFGRKVTAADLTPEMIVRAVSRIIVIEGMDASVALARPEELLSSVAAAAGARTTATPQPPAPAAAPSTPARTALQIVSAEVTPTRLRAGDKISLVVHYDVSGLAASAQAAVLEQRQLTFDGQALFTKPLAETVQRANGRHTSTFDFNIPAAAKPGVYTFTVTVSAADVSGTKDALFQIVQ